MASGLLPIVMLKNSYRVTFNWRLIGLAGLWIVKIKKNLKRALLPFHDMYYRPLILDDGL